MKYRNPTPRTYLTAVFLLSTVFSFSQTTLISATGDGGFETGPTFPANAWTTDNPAQTDRNQWTLGTGAAGYSGARCAYISNNVTGTPTHQYSLGAARVSHFWRNVTVPVGHNQIALGFSWLGYGESIYDYMRIWLVPTSYTPVYGTPITATGAAPTGQVQAGGYFNLQAAWTTASLNLPPAYAGTTFRLVFEWTNDGSLGTQPPAAIDNISLVSQAVAAPANNDCAGAAILTVNGGTACAATTSGSTSMATQSQAGCSGTADDDVWYRFVATAATHAISVTPGTLYDAVFEVFSGSCGALTSMTCIDSSFGTAAETAVISGLAVGSTYFVRVYSYASGADQGTFTLCVTTPVTPANDNCSGAVSLAVNPTATCAVGASGTTASATQSLAGCAGTADDDVWYSFTATGPTHVVTVVPDSLYDAVFQVFSGGCGVLSSLYCVDGTIGAPETATLTGLTAGATYYLRVYSYSAAIADQGTFTVCVTTPVPPANDNCTGAIALVPDEDCTGTLGTTSYATQSMPGCAGTADDDVWFSFVATDTSHTINVTPDTLYDAVFQVFSGSCGALTSVACTDGNIGATGESANITGLTVGATYYIRVYTYYNLAGDAGDFVICVKTPCLAGSGTGTTTLGCPSVISGGLSLNGADPAPIDCSSAGCVDLEATYLQLGQTTDYTVESIPFAPPYQFGCLANPVSVNDDDVWSPVVDLPFDFCFYGNTYNQCLISSNGVITFDQTNNIPGAFSAWEFTNNLPSTALFQNAIFGVYHDIDPNVGGEVGWELITLNTGCRALVAAWHDIPMFSTACNAQLYTGMIVLYENTNIIDVYIEEKNVCASWNGGNAVVGVQNAGGTLATVAPNRNSLDPDWIVTNEAWRFVPSGTPITSIRWHEGSGTAGPVVGTADILSVCPTTTTTYTAEVTYTLCNGATLVETDETTVTVNLNKVWNGSVSTNWNTAANWTPSGVPTALDCVVIPNTVNDCMMSGGGFAGYAFSVNVQNGGVLDIASGNNLTVTNTVSVATGGTFALHNSASLIQVNNTANTGIVTMERTTTPMYRFDYTYWSSPMTAASAYTLGMLSPATQPDKYYSWQPSVGGAAGDWIQESAASQMNPLKGYIIRAPQTFSTNPAMGTAYTGTFSGTPNNGNISAPISYGALGAVQTNDKWNLLGNPYPSAISAAAFLDNASNAAVIDGTIYFWTHNSPPSAAFPDPFYGDFVLNYTDSDYASWNKLGGVGTVASTGGPAPNGYIAAGQAFFVKSLAAPGSAQFTNSMRVANNNNQFFRVAVASTYIPLPDEEPIERHRVWLNMTNEAGAFNQILVGYAEGATLDYDRGLDGTRFNASSISFYSWIPGEKLAIQGRPLPFDVHDEVPLGYNATTDGTFTIRLDHVDGIFESQKIFLEDKWLNVVHNLRQSPYSFTASPGIADDRFVLRYKAIGKVNAPPHILTLQLQNQTLRAMATRNIASIAIYDMAGKQVATITQSPNPEFLATLELAAGIYLAKVKYEDGAVDTRKAVK
jgi:hypothetical protein